VNYYKINEFPIFLRKQKVEIHYILLVPFLFHFFSLFFLTLGPLCLILFFVLCMFFYLEDQAGQEVEKSKRKRYDGIFLYFSLTNFLRIGRSYLLLYLLLFVMRPILGNLIEKNKSVTKRKE